MNETVQKTEDVKEKPKKEVIQKKPISLTTPFRLFFKLILKIVKYIAEKIIGLILIMAVMYGGSYIYLQYHPDLEKRVTKGMKKLWELSQMTEEEGGISMDNIADIMKNIDISAVMQALGQGKKARPPVPGAENVPEQLYPMLKALKDSKEINSYITVFSKNKVGEDGAGAIPILKAALRSNNFAIREAAVESLRLIDTQDARLILFQEKK